VAQDIGKWLRDLCDSSCCWKRDKLDAWPRPRTYISRSGKLPSTHVENFGLFSKDCFDDLELDVLYAK